ncbi:MAG: hypothetical protein AAFO95_02110 [Cyanobacteria bacterium J06600_6]
MINKSLSLHFSILLIAIASISVSSQKAIAGNRMQDAISEAKALAARCQSSDSCSDCVEKNVIPGIIRKYRLESRREISTVSAAAREKCS